MIKELFTKLKQKRQKLESLSKIEKVEEEQKNFDMVVTEKNNIIKIQLSDYVSITEYVDKMKLLEKYNKLKGTNNYDFLLCNNVLWNNGMQKVNKGTYYIFQYENKIYNILLNDNKIVIDQRTKIDNIVEEYFISFNIISKNYNYSSLKHDYNRSTFYTKFYNPQKTCIVDYFNLPKEQAYEEIKNVLDNLERIESIKNIIDVKLLGQNILKDLKQKPLQKKL